MSKLLHMVITGCNQCPYCIYDGYYDMSSDSGYDCWHDNAPHIRLVDDGELKLYEDHDGPSVLDGVPEWCPLPNNDNNTVQPTTLCISCSRDSLTGIQDCGHHPTGMHNSATVTMCNGYERRII